MKNRLPNCTSSFFVAIALMLVIQACTISNKQKTADIPTIEHPVFEEIKLTTIDSFQLGDQTVNLWHWKLIGDKVISQVSGKDSILFIYSLPHFNILSKYGTYGNGPGEFLAANWGQTNKEEAIILYDINKKSLYNFISSGNNVKLKDTIALYGEIDGYPGMTKPYTMIQQLDDEVFLMKTDDPESTSLDIINLKTPEILSSYPIVFENRNNRTGYPPFDFTVSYNNDIVVIGYKFINRIEFYEISDKYELKPTLIIGNDQDQTDISPHKWQSFYTRMENDGKYVYLTNQSIHDQFTSVDIYTLDGIPVKRVVLDKYINNILLDQKNHKLYAHSQLEDIDQVYVYDFAAINIPLN